MTPRYPFLVLLCALAAATDCTAGPGSASAAQAADEKFNRIQVVYKNRKPLVLMEADPLTEAARTTAFVDNLHAALLPLLMRKDSDGDFVCLPKPADRPHLYLKYAFTPALTAAISHNQDLLLRAVFDVFAQECPDYVIKYWENAAGAHIVMGLKDKP